MTGVLISRGEGQRDDRPVETQRQRQNAVWRWRQRCSDTSPSQGAPKMAGSLQELGERRGRDSPPGPSEGINALTP